MESPLLTFLSLPKIPCASFSMYISEVENGEHFTTCCCRSTISLLFDGMPCSLLRENIRQSSATLVPSATTSGARPQNSDFSWNIASFLDRSPSGIRQHSIYFWVTERVWDPISARERGTAATQLHSLIAMQRLCETNSPGSARHCLKICFGNLNHSVLIERVHGAWDKLNALTTMWHDVIHTLPGTVLQFTFLVEFKVWSYSLPR